MRSNCSADRLTSAARASGKSSDWRDPQPNDQVHSASLRNTLELETPERLRLMRFLVLLSALGLLVAGTRPILAADGAIGHAASVAALGDFSHQGNAYWIVSSRHCPQRVDRVGCCVLETWSVEAHCSASETCQPSSGHQPTATRVGTDNLRGGLIPGVPVCVLVHGSYVSWHDARLESEGTYRWLRQACPHSPFQFIAFT
jgi:hypothetical protein